jgi:hypothetical protein
MLDRLRNDERGQGRGMIRNVMIAIVALALFGWIANIFLNIVPEENDTLSVISTVKDWGPDIIKMVVAAIIALVMAYVLNIFDRV